MQIAILDDHISFGELLVLPLKFEFEDCVVSNFQTISELKSSKVNYDLIILDLILGSESSIELINNDQKFLVISGTCDELIIKEIYSRGARGFLQKTCSIGQIITAIKTILDGNIYKKEIMKYHINRNVLLSKSEIEVLRKISTRKKYHEISDELFIDVSTVKRHVFNIKRKLKLNSKEEIINHYFENFNIYS